MSVLLAGVIATAASVAVGSRLGQGWFLALLVAFHASWMVVIFRHEIDAAVGRLLRRRRERP